MLLVDGDSISAGTGTIPYSPQLILPAKWGMRNVAVSGQTLAVAGPLAATAVDSFFVPNRVNVCIVWLGTNDIALNGTTPAATYTLLSNYIAARKAKGWKVITATMLSRVSFETQKNVFNPLVLANTAGADAVVDLTGTLLGCDGCSTNLGLFQGDQIHPNQTGQDTILKPAFQAAFDSIVP